MKNIKKAEKKLKKIKLTLKAYGFSCYKAFGLWLKLTQKRSAYGLKLKAYGWLTNSADSACKFNFNDQLYPVHV